MKYQRHSPVHWRVLSDSRMFSFETIRYMVPVTQARNPLAGQRSWKLRLGHLRVMWR